MEANPEKIRTEFAQETKDLVLAGFLAQPTASNPEHIVMETYEIYQNNSQKLSKWSPSPGFSCGAKVCDKVSFGVDRTVFRCLVPKIQAFKVFLKKVSQKCIFARIE